MALCSVENCGQTRRANGYCNKHNLRFRKYGDPLAGKRNHAPPQERFWRFVEMAGPDECWIFRCGSKTGSGHGKFQPGGAGTSGLQAHRWLYAQLNGPIPPGLIVMHSCDVPRCVNPAHLSLGTPKDNTQDMMAKGRNRWVAPAGMNHAKAILTDDDVRAIRASTDSHAALGRRFGVATTTIRNARSGRTWTSVT